MIFLKTASLYLMAIAYTLAGLNHFRAPRMYLKIMPPYLPAPELMVLLSGIAEVALGLALFPRITRPYAAWGVIALLIAVFPANLYMYQQRNTQFSFIPNWILVGRLPLQILLMAWAYWYTVDPV